MKDCEQHPTSEEQQIARDNLRATAASTRSSTRSGATYGAHRVARHEHIAVTCSGDDISLPYCLDYAADITMLDANLIRSLTRAGI